MRRVFLWLIVILSLHGLSAKISKHTSTSALRFIGSSELRINAPITSFSGTIIQDESSTMAGLGVQCSSTTLCSTGMSYVLTGTLRSTGIYLDGNQHVFAQNENIINAIYVNGTNNTILGKFNNLLSLVLQSGAQTYLGLVGDLNATVSLAGGTVELQADLLCGPQASFPDEGSIACDKYKLVLPGIETTLTSTLKFTTDTQLVLRNTLNLGGTLKFSGTGKATFIMGNDNVLDLSNGGQLFIGSAHSVRINDVTLKGLGGASSRNILFEDAQSTMTLANVRLVFANDYSFTQGRIYLAHRDSQFVVGANKVTFASSVTCSVDGITCYYDTLGLKDLKNISPTSANSTNFIYLNNGSFKAYDPSLLDVGLSVTGFYELARSQDLHAGRTLAFNASGSTIVFDGRGHELVLSPQDTALISLSANTQVIFRNTTFTGLSAAHFSMASGSGVTFNDNVYITLAKPTDLTMTWSVNGNVTIDGNGKKLNLVNHDACVVKQGGYLTLRNMRLDGVCNGGAGQFYTMRMMGSNSNIVLENTDVHFSNNYTHSLGNITIDREVVFAGPSQTFIYTATSPITVNTKSQLLLDLGCSFSYDTTSGSRSNIILSDATSLFALSGSTLYTTWTGINFTAGRLVLSNRVTFSSGGRNAAEGITLASGVRVEMLAGAALDVYGIVTYE